MRSPHPIMPPSGAIHAWHLHCPARKKLTSSAAAADFMTVVADKLCQDAQLPHRSIKRIKRTCKLVFNNPHRNRPALQISTF